MTPFQHLKRYSCGTNVSRTIESTLSICTIIYCFPLNVLFPHPWYIIYGILISTICFFNSRYFALLMWHTTLWWISQKKQPPMVFTSIFVPFNQYIKCNMNIVPSTCYIQQGRSLSVKLLLKNQWRIHYFQGGIANPRGAQFFHLANFSPKTAWK